MFSISNFINNKKGFTLVELLVVISIISFLSTIILSSMEAARARARDSKRIQEVLEVEKALHLYYSDYGVYPLTTGNGAWSALSVLVDGGYLSSVPEDPTQTSNCTDGQWVDTGCSYYYWRGKANSECNGFNYYSDFYTIKYVLETDEGNIPDTGWSPGCPIGRTEYGGSTRTNYITLD